MSEPKQSWVLQHFMGHPVIGDGDPLHPSWSHSDLFRIHGEVNAERLLDALELARIESRRSIKYVLVLDPGEKERFLAEMQARCPRCGGTGTVDSPWEEGVLLVCLACRMPFKDVDDAA